MWPKYNNPKAMLWRAWKLRLWRLMRAEARGSPAAAAEENGGDGLEHDAEVFHQALAPDVLQVVAHLGPHVIDRAVVVMIDLGQPGDPRLGPLAQGILGDVLPQLGEDGGPLRPGPHDVHVALEHVQHLGQLVQPVLPQQVAHRGDPGILLLGPYRPRVLLGVHPHGAELIYGEGPAPDVAMAAPILSVGA